MANYNLTSQQIKDSFQQLAQVSGSIEVGVSGYAVLDGTGSRVNTLHVTASNATSASYAPNTGVTSIIAGTNITVDQSTGDVTINSSGGGGAADTGSLLVTASNVDATITYTKGDGSTFQNTINNVANADTVGLFNDGITDGTQFMVLRTDGAGNLSFDYSDRTQSEIRATEAITKGDPLYVVGFNNGQNRIEVGIADASDPSKMPSFGLAYETVGVNQNSQMVNLGSLDDIDTQVTNDFQVGDTVYVAVGGGLTNVKPTGTNLIQNVGVVGRRAQTNGEILVSAIGRSNDLPNITEGYAWVGDSNGVPQPVATSSFAGGGAAFPFTGNAQITGSLVVSQSGLSSGEDVFVLGAPRGGGNSLEGVIRSTVDDGLHFYGNKVFNTGANTFSGGITGFESGPVQLGAAGSPVSLDMQNGSAITASNGTLPIKGNVDVDGNIAIKTSGTTLQVGDSTTPAGTPNVNLKQDYSGSAAKFANITIDDTSGTYTKPTLIGRFSNANPIGNTQGDPYTVIAGGADGGEFLHWGLVMDQSGDLKLLKEVAMRSGANITGSLDVSGAITASNASFQSASIGYLQTITGSATIIGDQYVVLNADSPTARFAGIKVYDSGSGLTGSFEWDSVDDNWIQVETGGSSAGMLTGVSGSKGSEAYPSNNTLLKGTGNHTVVDSSITDDGTVKINSNTQVTGSIDVTSTITNRGGSIQSFGGGGITVGNSGYALQYPSMNVYTNSGSYGGQIYGSHRITDLSGNGDVGILALSTFNSGDAGRICFETQFNGDVVWWISENKNNFHIEKQLNALAGAQITGSLKSSGSAVNLFQDSPTGNGQLAKSLEFSENTSIRGNTYDSNYIGAMNYSAFTDKTDKALTMWKGKSNLSEYGFIYNSGNTMGMYMRNVSGSTGDVSLFTDHGGSGDANFKVVADNIEIDPRSSFKMDGTSAFTSIEIGRDSITSFKLVTDEVNAIQITGSLDLTQDINTRGLLNTGSFINSGSFVNDGSLIYTGSTIGNLTALSITSNTASIDFRDGDYYTLDLVSGSNTHLEIDPSGTKPGQTAILKVKQPDPGSGTLSYGGNFKFPGGTIPSVTDGANSEDIFTFVQFGFNETYVTALNNMS